MTQLNILENFVEKAQTKKDLTYFINWWDNRRIHWSRAFKCDILAPTTNQAEAINATFQHRRSVRVSLVKAAQEDVSQSIIVESIWKGMVKGISPGTGPSTAVINEKQLTRQKQQAAKMAAEFEAFDQGINPTLSMFVPDENSHHRPDTAKERGRPKKKRRSAYEYYSDEEQPVEKRPCKLRDKPSKLFQKSLERALKEKTRFKVSFGCEFQTSQQI